MLRTTTESDEHGRRNNIFSRWIDRISTSRYSAMRFISFILRFIENTLTLLGTSAFYLLKIALSPLSSLTISPATTPTYNQKLLLALLFPAIIGVIVGLYTSLPMLASNAYLGTLGGYSLFAAIFDSKPWSAWGAFTANWFTTTSANAREIMAENPTASIFAGVAILAMLLRNNKPEIQACTKYVGGLCTRGLELARAGASATANGFRNHTPRLVSRYHAEVPSMDTHHATDGMDGDTNHSSYKRK